MKKKLAIISTFDDLCGIASYTRHLMVQLKPYYEITVFDLDQFVFRGDSNSLKKLADNETRRIVNELQNFDALNIQLEHGTLGKSPKDIVKRLGMFIQAAPAVCVTFHTVIPHKSLMSGVVSLAAKGRVKSAFLQYRTNLKNYQLVVGVDRLIRQAQTKKPTSVLVHTRRDAKNFKLIKKFDNVHNHPLAYLTYSEVEEIKNTTTLDKDFPQLAYNFKEGNVLLGVFGFFGRYKGLETVLSALRLLPENYHVAIFGGLHPNSIEANVDINEYLGSVVDQINPNRTMLDEWSDANKDKASKIGVDDFYRLIKEKSFNDLTSRVHFMGSLSDQDFPKAISICDVVLLPYLEVGQSASGPMSIAADMGAVIIASRTRAFMQFDRYNPNRIKMFDIGNYVQLSDMILAVGETEHYKEFESSKYTVESNVEVYKKALFWDKN